MSCIDPKILFYAVFWHCDRPKIQLLLLPLILSSLKQHLGMAGVYSQVVTLPSHEPLPRHCQPTATHLPHSTANSSLSLRVENRTHEIPFFGLHHVHRCVSTRGSCPSSLPRYIPHTCSHLESVRVQSGTEWTASVHTLHMPKPNVTRVQSATEWTASVHTLHMPKPIM